MTSRAASLALLLVLAACARGGGPAPVEYRGVGSGETSPGMAAARAPETAPEPYQGGSYSAPVTSGSVQAQELSPINPNSVSSVPLQTGEVNDPYAQAARQVPAQRPVLSPTPPPTASTQPVLAPAPTTTMAPAIDQGTGAFGWPLRGKILSGYGPKSGGRANDGINIAAPQGTPVHASKDGTVAYAGNELRSFGNMVLVRHDGGMFTVYAHLDQINVQKEQALTKGQVVGTVGQSGGVSEPQLHFEVRRGSTPLDPKKYLGK